MLVTVIKYGCAAEVGGPCPEKLQKESTIQAIVAGIQTNGGIMDLMVTKMKMMTTMSNGIADMVDFLLVSAMSSLCME